jgi:hypothetical protein
MFLKDVMIAQKKFLILFTSLTPKIPWDQNLVDCCLGNLCEEK